MRVRNLQGRWVVVTGAGSGIGMTYYSRRLSPRLTTWILQQIAQRVLHKT